MTARLPSGKFKSGVSGNPKGRPKLASTQMREALAKHGVNILNEVVEQALAGDMTAAKMIIDRLVPPLKPSAQPITIELPEAAGIAGTARAFVDAAAAGRVPADIASMMISALGNLVKIVEVDELTKRIELLEESKP